MSIRKARNGKINIWVDADDTILESSKTVIQIINERYGVNPPKTIDHLREWNYTCIYAGMTGGEVEAIYASTEFFERVKPNPEFITLYEAHKDDFNFIVVTKGNKENLDLKEAWFKKTFPEMYFVGIEFAKDGQDFDKSIIDMTGGIQIDDRTDALVSTNAELKILLKNGRDLEWNKVPRDSELYVVNYWREIKEILEFTLHCPEWTDLM